MCGIRQPSGEFRLFFFCLTIDYCWLDCVAVSLCSVSRNICLGLFHCQWAAYYTTFLFFRKRKLYTTSSCLENFFNIIMVTLWALLFTYRKSAGHVWWSMQSGSSAMVVMWCNRKNCFCAPRVLWHGGGFTKLQWCIPSYDNINTACAEISIVDTSLLCSFFLFRGFGCLFWLQCSALTDPNLKAAIPQIDTRMPSVWYYIISATQIFRMVRTDLQRASLSLGVRLPHLHRPFGSYPSLGGRQGSPMWPDV